MVFIFWSIHKHTSLIKYLENLIFWLIWCNLYSGSLSCDVFYCCTDTVFCCCCFKLLGPKYFLLVGSGVIKQEKWQYKIVFHTYLIICMFYYSLDFIIVIQTLYAAFLLTSYLPAGSTTAGYREHTLTSLLLVTSLLLFKWWNNLTPLTSALPY